MEQTMDNTRENLVKSIRRYRDRYPAESEVAERFIEFITNYRECAERSHLSRHLTGAAWLVNRAHSHVLLTHHRKLNLWLQLGGHADGDIDMIRVATREAYEESGLKEIRLISDDVFDLDIHTIPANKSVPEHEHYDIRYTFEAIGDESYKVSDESHDLRWVEISDIRRYTNEPTMIRMSQKWTNR